MNLIAFPVSTTNIFPIANSHAGGQLLTEYNLRSRESVNTDSSVEYMIGPSYTHSDRDFAVTLQSDASGVAISSTALQIAPGRALVNGHYVESLADIVVDIAECNAKLRQDGLPVLKGNLTIGLRVMYSTETTMSGSMLVENAANMYAGIQVVILPTEGEVGTKFTLPSDSPTDITKVNAHLKLATFSFVQGSIASTSIVSNPNKSKVVSADKISNVADLISEVYIKKTGLNPKKIYTFSGKGTDPATGYDTWCDSTDSLIVWDETPDLQTGAYPGVGQAMFDYNPITGKTVLHLPHKQPDGMSATDGTPQYYADKLIELPVAKYGTNVGGTVDKNFISSIKAIDQKIQNFYRLPQGELKYYYSEVLADRKDLPPIYGNNNWNVGDYVLVGQDATTGVDGSLNRLPATLYVVLPGAVATLSYTGNTTSDDAVPAELVDGVELGRYEMASDSFDPTDVTTVEGFWDFTEGFYRGVVGKDYFRVQNTVSDVTTYYFYAVATTDRKVYSDPVWITAEIPLAQETAIGGFLNVPETALGYGYVYRTNEGYLRLLDYDLLVTGVLAYQLGQDYTIPAGLSLAEIQTNLDDHVNQRVCFPNTQQQQNAETPNIINVYIDLSEESEVTNLYIHDIDSRFGAILYLHFTGEANSNTIINISNCEKVRLDISCLGNPIFNLYRSNLYYDSTILDRLTIIEDLGLWYQRFTLDDPDILVDGMTVELVGRPDAIMGENYWTVDAPNDNHYLYALKSITFANDGTVIRCSLLVADDVTANVAEGKYISAFEFKLPQGLSLTYPVTRLSRQLKVTGQFITAYPISSISEEGYIVKDTSFTAVTQAYTQNDVNEYVSGTISFYTVVTTCTNVSGVSSTQAIDGWESGEFHIFSGGTIE